MDCTCTFLIVYPLESIIFFKNSKNKSYFYLEMDTKVQTKEISKEKEN